jgi:hypothetical protein
VVASLTKSLIAAHPCIGLHLSEPSNHDTNPCRNELRAFDGAGHGGAGRWGIINRVVVECAGSKLSRCQKKTEIEKWWPIIKAAGIQAE